MGIECYVVSANCSIDVLSYTYNDTIQTQYDWAYTNDNPNLNIFPACTPTFGHIKMNGAVVWQGSACTNFCNPCGVNTLLIDPFTCSVLQSRRFDTWSLRNAATQLINYLKTLKDESVIVGVTADEVADAAELQLLSALTTLRQFGVDVGDWDFAGSFAFIAQKAYPGKTALSKVVTRDESLTSPARLNAVITGRTDGHLCCSNAMPALLHNA